MHTQLDLTSLVTQFTKLDRLLLQREGEYKALNSMKTRLRAEIDHEKAQAALYEKTTIVVQKLTELSRQENLDKIAAIVTKAIQDVKDPTLSFRINYKVERNQPAVDFVIFNSRFNVEQNIKLSCGGTLEDLAEFPLRVSLLLKWRPKLGQLLIFDEAFTQVSKQDRPAFASFIRQLSEELNLQIILITHSTDLVSYAHKVLKVEHDGQKSSITDATSTPEVM